MEQRTGLFLIVAVVAVSTLACSEFCMGITFGIEDLMPLHTPVPGPTDAEILENGLTVAEDANSGTHVYTRELESRGLGRGANFAEDFFSVDHEFTGDQVAVSFDDYDPITYTNIAPNTYQRTIVSGSQMTQCAVKIVTLTYNAHGYTIFLECQDNDKKGLFIYEMFPLEQRLQ